MKKAVLMAIAALGFAALAQESSMSLADARGKIGEAVVDTAKMGEIISQLSAEDQVSFLSDVNAAIDKMPGSNEEKAAAYLNANTAAMKNAKKGNLQNLLAEMFATVSPEALTVINEKFASDLFNRSADPSRPMSDEDFLTIATNTMAVIQEKVSTTDDPGVRETFAALMFIRASNGSPANLRDVLVANMPDAATRELAANEWIPAALGEGQDKTYEPMLGASDAGDAPSLTGVVSMAYYEGESLLLASLASSDEGILVAKYGLDNLGLPRSISDTTDLSRVPRTGNPYVKWNSGIKRGEDAKEEDYTVPSEPDGYFGQTY